MMPFVLCLLFAKAFHPGGISASTRPQNERICEANDALNFDLRTFLLAHLCQGHNNLSFHDDAVSFVLRECVCESESICVIIFYETFDRFLCFFARKIIS